MNRVLYFPHMNLPVACPALDSSIIFADEVNIIAPFVADIKDERTRDLLNSGLVRRTDPGLELEHQDFEIVGRQLENFLKSYPPSLKINKTLEHRDDNFSIHAGKMMLSNMQIHRGKLNLTETPPVHANRIVELLYAHNITAQAGDYYVMPKEIGLYILGLLAHELVKRQKFDIVSSSNVMPEDQSALKNSALRKLITGVHINLMPTFNLRELRVEDIVELKRNYGTDLRTYVSSLTQDVNLIMNSVFERIRKKSDPLIVDKEIEEQCRQLVKHYERDLATLERHINSSNRYNLERALFSVVFPAVVAVAVGGDIGALLAGFIGCGSLAIPNLNLTPSHLSRQKVVYDINKFHNERTRRR